MNICEHCINDETLKHVIISAGEPGTCDICKKDSQYVYDTEKRSDLTPFFEQLIRIYQPFESSYKNVPKSERMYLQAFVKKAWNIFNDDVNEDQIGYALIDLCPDMYEIDKNLFEGHVFLRNAYNIKYLQEHSLLKNNTWEDFERNIKESNRFHSNDLNLEILRNFCSYLKVIYPKGTRFYRSRIGKVEGYKPEEMGAPPVEYTQDSRVSAKGIRCLYLADSSETTLYETRAAKYDYVSIGIFELQKDIAIVDLTQIRNISPFILPDDGIEELAVNSGALQMIDATLGKAVSRSGSQLDYVPTQYIADYIKSISEHGQQVYQGIQYRSVMHPSGKNLAIFGPDLFKCINVSVSRIDEISYKTENIGNR